ncbi:MAG: antitermination protein NusB [Desulfovibrio sp.]|jgi:16S rRNA (cytosine967-C5)-methyltransferase|nr:antitermination protein NusB [Desulfovibrio sp.]
MKRVRGVADLPQGSRRTVLEALARLDRDGVTAQAALDAALGASSPDPRRRRQTAELFYGYLREQIRCAHLVRRHLRRPETLPPLLLRLLELGVYTLRRQDGVPAYAAVHETVEDCRRLFGKGLAGLGNAVLRSVQRLGDAVEDVAYYREGGADEELALALRHSLPRDVVTLWRKAYGEADALALMERSQARPWRGVRLNPLHPGHEELRRALVEAGGVPCGFTGLAFAPGTFPDEASGRGTRELESAGALSFQAAGSQQVLRELHRMAPVAGPVWDGCAGRGGKALCLSEQGVAVPWCSDVSPGRMEALPARCRVLGLEAPRLFLADMARPPFGRGAMDILLDVPCTGLGVLSRRPDLRRRFRGESVERMALLQRAMLEACLRRLAPGRRCWYVTCTLDPVENGGVVRGALGAVPGCELVGEWTTPHGHRWMEGMYGAAIRR